MCAAGDVDVDVDVDGLRRVFSCEGGGSKGRKSIYRNDASR